MTKHFFEIFDLTTIVLYLHFTIYQIKNVDLLRKYNIEVLKETGNLNNSSECASTCVNSFTCKVV